MGAGRSGSTLLDMLLNNHSQIQSVGEVHRLNYDSRTNNEPCTCGKPIIECPFWLRVQEEAQLVLGCTDEPLLKTKEMMLRPGDMGRMASFLQKGVLVFGNSWLYDWVARRFCKAHYQSARNSLFWYEMIRRVTGCSIIVDSSKDARRLKVLYLTEPEPFKLIYMIRDGRAVAASKMRGTDMSMKEAAMWWVSANNRSLWSQRGIPPPQILRVHYEVLCRELESTMRHICDFLDIPFDEKNMLVLKKTGAHSIGGNPMRFRKNETKIQLDERWRKQLSKEDLLIFDRIAGKMNRQFGY